MHTIQVTVSHCSKIDVQQETVETTGDPVQYNYDFDGALSLLDLLKADAEVTALLPPAEIEANFDLDYHYRHIDTIFARVFG